MVSTPSTCIIPRIIVAKRVDLRSKLKAADRRRSRRPSNRPGSTATPNPKSTGDVPGLIVEAILSYCDQSQRFEDKIIIAALRACESGVRPRGEQAAELYDQLQRTAARNGLATRELVRASRALLAQSDRCERNSAERNPFASYLCVLVS
jgi:hypothetical protein